MRDLTPEECEFISGGLDPAGPSPEIPPVIVVTASPPPPPPVYYPPPPPPPYLPPTPPYSGGGGGGGPSPAPAPAITTPGASAAANAFANAHLTDDNPNSATHKKYAQTAHDEMAKFYDYAMAHPNAVLHIGDRNITAAQVLNDMQNERVFISSSNDASLIGPNGARTINHFDGSTGAFKYSETYINPDNANLAGRSQDYINYAILHEIGHEEVNSLYTFTTQPTGNAGETAADTAAQSIAAAIGVTLPTIPPGGFPH